MTELTTVPDVREVPKWLNLDALITPDELDQVTAIIDEVRRLADRVLEIRGRVEWALDLGDGLGDDKAEDVLVAFHTATGIDDLYTLIGTLAVLEHHVTRV